MEFTCGGGFHLQSNPKCQPYIACVGRVSVGGADVWPGFGYLLAPIPALGLAALDMDSLSKKPASSGILISRANYRDGVAIALPGLLGGGVRMAGAIGGGVFWVCYRLANCG